MKTFLYSCEQKRWQLPLLALAICATFTAAGCIEPEEEANDDATSTSTISNPPVGVVDDSAGFYVQAQASENYTYVTHRGAESGISPPTYPNSFTWTQACVAAAGENIMCYVEGAELDLWVNGVVLQHNIPSTMCSYFSIEYPWFFKYPAGKGSTDVTVEQDVTTINDKVNSHNNGTPYCPFDYTEDDGPNCCEGDYKLHTLMAVGVTGTPTNTDASWGGKASDCAVGPAMDFPYFDKRGFPIGKIYYVDGTGANDINKVASPQSREDTTNLFVANYFDIDPLRNYFAQSTANPLGLRASDYPPGLRPTANSFMDDTSTIPIPGSGGLFVSGAIAEPTPPQPFYQYTCYDRYMEVISRIRVMVRSWDTESQIGSASSYSPNHDYETDIGDTDEPLHDMGVWGDYFFNYFNGDSQTSGDSVRLSRPNTTTECSAGPVYTNACQVGYSSYTDGFPQNL
jgi:hypothetical protein